jgi:hypothetical protein
MVLAGQLVIVGQTGHRWPNWSTLAKLVTLTNDSVCLQLKHLLN